jgi:hypothetical protein
MPTLGDVNLDSLYCLFKGEPGTRKSTCALSFPKPQYWFSWDQKMEGLLLPMKAWNVDPKQIHFDDYTDWNKVRAKLEQFQTNCPYKTIIIDSITSGSDAINRQTLKIKRGANEGKTIASIPVNSIEDFNAEDSALKEMVALTKDIGKYHKLNVILIAHVIQKEIKTADGKTHMSRTLVTAGKGIAQKIPAYCPEVYHFNISSNFTGGGQYALKTTHTGDDFARTSLPLREEIQFGNDPLYDKWIAPAIQKMKPTTQPSNTPTTQQPTNTFTK